MLITYRGRQHDSTSHADPQLLAARIGPQTANRVGELQINGAIQTSIDRALWEAILRRVPGALGGAR